MASIHPVCLVVTQHTQSHTQSHYNHAHHHTQAHTVTQNHNTVGHTVTHSHTAMHCHSHTCRVTHGCYTHSHTLFALTYKHNYAKPHTQFLKITCIRTWDVIQNYSCHCTLFPLRCGRVFSAHSHPGQTVLLLQLLQRALNR